MENDQINNDNITSIEQDGNECSIPQPLLSCNNFYNESNGSFQTTTKKNSSIIIPVDNEIEVQVNNNNSHIPISTDIPNDNSDNITYNVSGNLSSENNNINTETVFVTENGVNYQIPDNNTNFQSDNNIPQLNCNIPYNNTIPQESNYNTTAGCTNLHKVLSKIATNYNDLVSPPLPRLHDHSNHSNNSTNHSNSNRQHSSIQNSLQSSNPLISPNNPMISPNPNQQQLISPHYGTGLNFTSNTNNISSNASSYNLAQLPHSPVQHNKLSTPSKVSSNLPSSSSQKSTVKQESTLLTPVKLNPTQTNTIRYLDEASGVEYDIITVPKQNSHQFSSTPQKSDENIILPKKENKKGSRSRKPSEKDNNNSDFRKWSEAEHAALEKLVSLHGHDWEKVAANLLVSKRKIPKSTTLNYHVFSLSVWSLSV